MAFRMSCNRKIKLNSGGVRTARHILREHMKYEGKQIYPDLSTAWNMHKNSAYRRMYCKRPMTVQMIEAAIEMLGLDAFDATELRRQGAIEAGWKIDLDVKVI